MKVQCKKVYLKERDNGDSEMVNMKITYKSGVRPHICFIAHYYIPDEASTEAIQSFSYLYASVSSNVSNSNRPKYSCLLY